MGLAGDDNLHFKVSSDGSAFFESLVISGASGLVTVKNNIALDPQASDPSTSTNGQIWYNSTSGKFRAKQNGTNIDLSSGVGVSDGDKGDIIVSGSGTVWSLDAAPARSTLSINNVDNTSDLGKPVSTAQQTALNLKAALASPVFSGSPAAPTAAALSNNTTLATTAYADAADLVAAASVQGQIQARFLTLN